MNKCSNQVKPDVVIYKGQVKEKLRNVGLKNGGTKKQVEFSAEKRV